MARRNTETEKELARAVKSYNQRIDRAVKSGRLRPEIAPERKSVKEIKAEFAHLSPMQRGKALANTARELRKISERNALQIVKTAGGVEMTRFELNAARAEYKKAKRRKQQEAKRRKQAQAKAPKIGGVDVEPPREWGENLAPPNPDKPQDFETFRQRVERTRAFLNPRQWSFYREDLLKNLEMHYTGADLERIKDALKHISDANLEKAYRDGATFAEQSYHYEAGKSVEKVLESMKPYFDIDVETEETETE